MSWDCHTHHPTYAVQTMVVDNSLNHSEVHLIFHQLAMSGDLGNHIVSPKITSLSFSAFKLTIKSWCCKRMRKNHIIFQRSSKEQKKFYQLIICTQRLAPLTLFISGHASFVNLMGLGTHYPRILWSIPSTSFISSVSRYPPTANSPSMIGNTVFLGVVLACDATRWCFKTLVSKT